MRTGRVISSFFSRTTDSPAVSVMAFTLACLVLLGVTGCSSREAGERDKPVPVEVRLPSRADLAVTLNFVGEIRGNREASLNFEVGGRVADIRADISGSVKKGDVLASLDDTGARANLIQAQVGFSKAKLDAERIERLRGEGIASDHQLESARLAMEQARANLVASEEFLKNCTLTAPFPGFVAARNIEVGEVMTPGVSLSPNFVLVDIRSVKVKIGVPESELGRIKAEQPVTLSVSAYPGRHFSGRVSAVSPLVSEATRTAEVEVAVENPDYSLKPGMTAELAVKLGVHRNVMVVPERSVKRDVGLATLFVVSEGRAHQRSIRTGIIEDTWVEVLSGLGESDSVVVTGQFQLKENDRVSVLGTGADGGRPAEKSSGAGAGK